MIRPAPWRAEDKELSQRHGETPTRPRNATLRERRNCSSGLQSQRADIGGLRMRRDGAAGGATCLNQLNWLHSRGREGEWRWKVAL